LQEFDGLASKFEPGAEPDYNRTRIGREQTEAESDQHRTGENDDKSRAAGIAQNFSRLETMAASTFKANTPQINPFAYRTIIELQRHDDPFEGKFEGL
jgi:hypothetical protein